MIFNQSRKIKLYTISFCSWKRHIFLHHSLFMTMNPPPPIFYSDTPMGSNIGNVWILSWSGSNENVKHLRSQQWVHDYDILQFFIPCIVLSLARGWRPVSSSQSLPGYHQCTSVYWWSILGFVKWVFDSNWFLYSKCSTIFDCLSHYSHTLCLLVSICKQTLQRIFISLRILFSIKNPPRFLGSKF